MMSVDRLGERGAVAAKGAGATSGVTFAENFVSPISSCGATCLKNASGPCLACSSLSSSGMEPELSSTSITLAGLRSRRQVVSTG